MLRPMEDRIAIKKDEVEEKKSNGIYIPTTAQMGIRYNTGVVAAVGPGRWIGGSFVTPTVTPGEKIAYSALAGMEVTDTDGTVYTIINSSDILAAF